MSGYWYRKRVCLFILTTLCFLYDSCGAFVVDVRRAWKVELLGSLGNNEIAWKAEGERIITEAAIKAGAHPEQITIQWKPGRIIVTVAGDVKMNAKEDDEGVVVEYDGNIDEDEISAFEEEFDIKSVEDDSIDIDGSPDIVSIARSINDALGKDGEESIGYSIAEHHEIEVTTPGNPEELQGIMFDSYRGFDVILEELDQKDSSKFKIVECKFVERTEEKTVVNVKGRLRKIKNELVKSIRLPKAKKEKGMR